MGDTGEAHEEYNFLPFKDILYKFFMMRGGIKFGYSCHQLVDLQKNKEGHRQKPPEN